MFWNKKEPKLWVREKDKMNREKICTMYDVKDGKICSPGKFEGEPIYSPYFYDISLHDCIESYNGDDDCFSEVILDIQESDRKMFPEIPEGVDFVSVSEYNDGLVSVQLLSEKDLEKIKAYYNLWYGDF